jgi:O-acetyl-ADP-ribose deacetylase (regulator of RNase III)
MFESGADVMLHQVNCQGVMGSGIAKQVKNKYPHVFARYKELCDRHDDKSLLLGVAQCVKADDNSYIVNLFSQENFGYDGRCYTNYEALRQCLEFVKTGVCFEGDTIAIPYLIGCCRGGGNWDIVYKMIEEVFSDGRNDVLICEYNGG